MRKWTLLVTVTCLALIQAPAAHSQIDWEHFFDHPIRDVDTPYIPLPTPPPTTIASYTFDGCTPAGWTSLDLNDQPAYFHVDDFAGMPGWAPLAGTKSLWCGARQDGSGPLCAYATLPGYGNNWHQYWTMKNCLPMSGTVNVSFSARWSIEPTYDGVWVEVDACDDMWARPAGTPAFTGNGTSPAAIVSIAPGAHAANARVRLRFESDSVWSDEDGLWNSTGAILIDNLTVSDAGGVVVPMEDFEGESVGALSSNDWQAGTRPGLGDFAALLPGTSVLQEDPHETDITCLWAFITGSTVDYSCGGHPEQTAIAYTDNGISVRNEIRSPWIPFSGPAGYATSLKFDVYRDLPFDNLVFYQWAVREKLFLESCPSLWRDDNTVYYGDRKDWYHASFPLTTHLYASSSSDQIQVALRVVDLTPEWGGTLGSGACHSHAPLFDNISIVREFGVTVVPRSLSFFQDGFSDDGSLTGTVSINGVDSDNLSFQIADPSSPIDYFVPNDPNSGPAVFLNVKNLPNKLGSVISGGQQWPVVSTGQEWTVVQMSPGTAENEYIVDLNDQLYTPGDKVQYYISARNQNNQWLYWSSFTGVVSEVTAQAYPMEMTCLPTVAGQAARNAAMPTAVEILYVDASSGLGGQPLIESAMSQLGLNWDRFDRNEPLQSRNNGLGDAAAFPQIEQYSCIIWDTGDIYNGVLTDADFALMLKYLESRPGAGLFLAGDNAARALATSSSSAAATLRANYFNFTLQTDNHQTLLPAVSPALLGVNGSPFAGQSAIAYVGDGGFSHFDVLSPDGAAFVGMYYDNPAFSALLFQDNNFARTALAGFSLQAVRDDSPNGIPDRTQVLSAVLNFFGKQASPVGASTVKRTFLSPNVPNPFNPTTAIAYSLAAAGPVTLRIYDVAGRLVRTLVDRTQSPAGSATVTWDGRDGGGTPVASGVYFYRLQSGSFASTRKMILLK